VQIRRGSKLYGINGKFYQGELIARYYLEKVGLKVTGGTNLGTYKPVAGMGDRVQFHLLIMSCTL
jgi:hypothetical protein